MRALLLCLAACLLTFSLVSAQSAPATTWTCPEGYAGQQLNVFNWSTYIAEDTIANFEALCGVTVTYDVFESDDALVSRLRQGNPGYDIVVPSDASVPLMVNDGLLEPLDFARIPNYANIADAYKNTIFDPDNRYTVPYLSGTFGIGYDTKKVSGEVTSWEQFFTHDGPVAWVDDSRAMIPIGLLMAGHDPNAGSPAAIADAKAWLIANSANVAVVATDDGQELLARGEVDMAIEYNGDIFQINLDCECEQFGYSIPVEGSGFSAGFIGVPVGAQNQPLAEVFIDYLLDPQVAADIANYTTYPSPNQAAIDAGLIDPALLENPAIYPDAAKLARLFYIQTPPEAEERYLAAWDEIKIAISR
jgi:spermidine/putrescine transport system substrate-binding protein